MLERPLNIFNKKSSFDELSVPSLNVPSQQKRKSVAKDDCAARSCSIEKKKHGAKDLDYFMITYSTLHMQKPEISHYAMNEEDLACSFIINCTRWICGC